VVSTFILLAYMETLSYLAGVAAETTLSTADLHGLAKSPLLHSSAALLVLLVATALSVYKPQGMTPYGWRKQQKERHRQNKQRTELQP
jgi:membrane-anchored glycerophosphoryl diester phosphodiesterase (GDPDase)